MEIKDHITKLFYRTVEKDHDDDILSLMRMYSEKI